MHLISSSGVKSIEVFWSFDCPWRMPIVRLSNIKVGQNSIFVCIYKNDLKFYVCFQFTGVAQRAQYKPPQGYFSPSLARFEKYLEDTQVQVLFQRLLYMLLNRPELPYNPFPGFYGRLRMNMEKYEILYNLRGLSQKVVDFLYIKKTTVSIAIKFYL